MRAREKDGERLLHTKGQHGDWQTVVRYSDKLGNALCR